MSQVDIYAYFCWAVMVIAILYGFLTERGFMYKLWCLVGQYGRKVGLSMVTLVALWDVALIGLRGFSEYTIGYKGIVVILAGVYLVWAGHKIESND